MRHATLLCWSVLTAWFLALTARADFMTFDAFTNASYRFPLLEGGSVDVNTIGIGSQLTFTGPYGVFVHPAVNPANGTKAIALDSTVAAQYVLLMWGVSAPFALNGFDVLSVNGSFVLFDTQTGARYTNNGTAGRVTLGPAFGQVRYVEMILNGQLVIDNIEYTVLHHVPVVGLQVQNELQLPSLSFFLDNRPPGHLENPAAYQYPGYQGYTHYLLAPGTNPVPFVVDASATHDPDGDPITFEWSYYIGNDEGDWYPLLGGRASTSPYFTNQPPYLNNFTARKIILEINDLYQRRIVWFGVEVITPQQATDIMREWLEEHFENRRSIPQRRLIPTLRRASAAFAEGNSEAGVRFLRLFQHQTKVRFRPQHRKIATPFLEFSQAVMDAVNVPAATQ